MAQLEMIIAVYKICKQYRIELVRDHDFSIDAKVTIQPKGNVHIKMYARIQ